MKNNGISAVTNVVVIQLTIKDESGINMQLYTQATEEFVQMAYGMRTPGNWRGNSAVGMSY